jgi:hypothetical protein
MSDQSLTYLSTKVEQTLRASIEANLARYLSGDFSDVATDADWNIPLTIAVDLEPLFELIHEKGSAAEVANSLVVWKCLSRLTPALANESRIWTRLTHVEGLSYARARWIEGATGERAVKRIADHFFGATRTARRDDNAVGRLWWNAYVAHQAAPDHLAEALAALLKTADIRSNIIERPWISSRPALSAGIVRVIMREPRVTASEKSFRQFMKNVNRTGGGLLFEVMGIREVDAFLLERFPA